MRQVLYFSADWCEPCQRLKPQIAQLRSQMTIVDINIDISYQSAQTWNVRSVPAIIVIENAREIGRLVGSAITPQSVINLYNK